VGANKAFAARTSHDADQAYSWQIVTVGLDYDFSSDTRSSWRSQLGAILEVEDWIIEDIDFVSPVERSTFELDFGLRTG
jgi:hypothetical protein